MAMKEPGRLVLVRWRDSCSPVRKWHDDEVGRTYTDTECVSVGWLMRRDKKSLAIAATFSDGGGIADLTAIPAGCVVSVTPIGKGKKA